MRTMKDACRPASTELGSSRTPASASVRTQAGGPAVVCQHASTGDCVWRVDDRGSACAVAVRNAQALTKAASRLGAAPEAASPVPASSCCWPRGRRRPLLLSLLGWLLLLLRLLTLPTPGRCCFWCWSSEAPPAAFHRHWTARGWCCGCSQRRRCRCRSARAAARPPQAAPPACAGEPAALRQRPLPAARRAPLPHTGSPSRWARRWWAMLLRETRLGQLRRPGLPAAAPAQSPAGVPPPLPARCAPAAAQRARRAQRPAQPALPPPPQQSPAGRQGSGWSSGWVDCQTSTADMAGAALCERSPAYQADGSCLHAAQGRRRASASLCAAAGAPLATPRPEPQSPTFLRAWCLWLASFLRCRA